MRFLRVFLALVSLTVTVGFATAQTASTSLRGIVSDPSGATIADASVAIKNNQVGTQANAKTNAQGEYSFQQLTPGHYTITVNSQGFAQQVITANLLVAQPATVDVKLSLTADNVTVDVSGATEAINTTDASIGNAINNETIMQLPSDARNPQTLLALQPGVLYLGNNTNVSTSTASSDSRNGAVSGARPDQTNITLDGLDNNDQIAPAAFTGVLRTTLDATEEFRVTTSNANADTGRSSGGQVNLITRSGTNNVHGALYEYNRSNIFEANDWFVKAGQISSGIPNTPPKLIRNTYGARLGGPIKRDKIFLFGNYEGSRINEGQNVTETVPTASLRAGNLMYPTLDGSNVTLTPSQVATMDPRCTANGTCPQGPGDNPASLALFKTYPLPNGFNTGDGLNTASYTFSSPTPTVLNVYIARMDFNPSDKHRFYVRGSFQNDQQSGTAAFPGQPASTKATNDSRGIAANYTWTVNSNIVNNLRYGYTHQSFANTGVGNGNYVTFRSLSTPEATTRSSFTAVPLHNLVDDITWTKGKHTLQFGGNYRRFTYNNSTNANSYNSAIANAYWMQNSGFAGHGGSFDPAAFGLPAVSDGSNPDIPSFTTNYDFAVSMLAGLTNEETDRVNYSLSSDGTKGNLLAVGAPVVRSFRANEFEYYAEDSFKPTPNLTITAGLRHTILQTPWETNGQQVQPTINIDQWFKTRGQQAALGNSVQPTISFAPSGKAHNAKPFYPMNWGNIAPRFAFAYSPAPEAGSWMNKLLGGAGKSSIRAGFGIYYDHYGEGLVTNYSRAGSFSLSSSLSNPSSVLTADTTPRFSGLHNLPGLIPAQSSSIAYPQTPSTDPNGTGFAITSGLDDHLQTPYSEVFNLSFQREIKGGFTIEADYIGRLGRHLLQQIDLAQPLNLVDPKSGSDYYTAGTQLSKYVDEGRTADTIPTIAYFENLFPDAKGAGADGSGTPGYTATQNIYNNLWQYVRGNETAALEYLDIACSPGCGGKIGRYWPVQYSSLYVTSSLGTSSYNAAQITLRHAMRHDFQFDLSYTLSNSLDMGSDSESNPTSSGNSYGFIIDAFNPYKNYARSDFNTTHLLTGDWVLQLPVGHGQPFAGNAGHLVNAVIGGWTTSGIIRLSSGLPFSIYDGDGWSTNWEYEGGEVQTGPIKMRKHITSNGSPQVFDTPPTNHVNLRDPYPGEAGQRNNFIGDGYFDIDAGLHKVFALGDRYHVELAAELFNVTNTVRFDVHQLDTGSTDGSQLGVYSGALTTPRHAQLSGRFEF